MPQRRDHRSQVLHWDDVYAQFATAAESMPIEDVDRELAAKGYNLDKVRGAVGRLGRHAGARTAETMSAASRDAVARDCLSLAPPPALRAIEYAGGAPERYQTQRWRAKTAAAGVVGAVLVGLLALPISDAVVARWPGASIARSGDQTRGPEAKLAEAKPVVAARPHDRNSGSPDKAKEVYRTKVAMLKKCGAGHFKGSCREDKPTFTGGKQPSPEHDDKGKGVTTSSKSPELPRIAAQTSGYRPTSAG